MLIGQPDDSLLCSVGLERFTAAQFICEHDSGSDSQRLSEGKCVRSELRDVLLLGSFPHPVAPPVSAGRPFPEGLVDAVPSGALSQVADELPVFAGQFFDLPDRDIDLDEELPVWGSLVLLGFLSRGTEGSGESRESQGGKGESGSDEMALLHESFPSFGDGEGEPQ
jgi:hypothetical protein